MWDKKIGISTLALMLWSFCLLVAPVYAGEMHLAAGESRVINTRTPVDTVFVSAAELADYEIINDNTVVIYGRKEGQAEFTLFDKGGKIIAREVVIINDLLRNIDRQIRAEYPDSNVRVQKIAKAYVLTGTVSTEEARERIYQLVGEATGAKKHTIEFQLKDENKSEKERITFMDKVTYDQVVNRITLAMTNQVNVKLTIAEVTKEFSDNVGIDWSSNGRSPGTFTLQKFKFDATALGTVISAISNDSIARVLAEPNLSVLSGETADFLVGGEYPIAVISNLGASSVDYKKFGISLSIGARVNDNNRIRVLLSEEVSVIDEKFIKNGVSATGYPVLTARRAKTTVELGDGESFILGGLINNEEKEALAKIPFIGSIPILGALFRHTSTARKGSELIVVATVNLVKPVAPKDVVLPHFVQTSTAERFFNFTAIRGVHSKKQAMEFIAQGGFIQ